MFVLQIQSTWCLGGVRCWSNSRLSSRGCLVDVVSCCAVPRTPICAVCGSRTLTRGTHVAITAWRCTGMATHGSSCRHPRTGICTLSMEAFLWASEAWHWSGRGSIESFHPNFRHRVRRQLCALAVRRGWNHVMYSSLSRGVCVQGFNIRTRTWNRTPAGTSLTKRRGKNAARRAGCRVTTVFLYCSVWVCCAQGRLLNNTISGQCDRRDYSCPRSVLRLEPWTAAVFCDGGCRRRWRRQRTVTDELADRPDRTCGIGQCCDDDSCRRGDHADSRQLACIDVEAVHRQRVRLHFTCAAAT